MQDILYIWNVWNIQATKLSTLVSMKRIVAKILFKPGDGKEELQEVKHDMLVNIKHTI